jgi:hypothetical protein
MQEGRRLLCEEPRASELVVLTARFDDRRHWIDKLILYRLTTYLIFGISHIKILIWVA